MFGKALDQPTKQIDFMVVLVPQIYYTDLDFSKYAFRFCRHGDLSNEQEF
jgi:hypothetical protein